LEAYAATFVILPFQDISCQASFRGFLSPGTAIFTTAAAATYLIYHRSRLKTNPHIHRYLPNPVDM
jgi:hypothetical protein